MKKTLLFIITVASIFSACVDHYDIATPEELPLQFYTNAIVSPVVKIGESHFALFKTQDSKIYLGRVDAEGKCSIKSDLSKVFREKYTFDSLTICDMYQVKGKLAIFQQGYKNYNDAYWRINIIDTSANIELQLSDTCHVADTIYKRHLHTIAGPEKIRSYYVIGYDGYTHFYGLAVDEYDYQGQYQKTYIDTSASSYYMYFLPAYRHNYSLVGMYNNADTTGFFKFANTDTSFVLKKFSVGKYYETTYSTSLDQNKALLTVEDYQRELFIHIVYDFDKMEPLITIDDPILGRFLVTNAFGSGDKYVLTGFNWDNEGFEFSFPNLLTARGTWNTTVVDNSGAIIWTANQATTKRLALTAGTIQKDEYNFTTFGYGKTLEYFPATIVIKFNSNDFKIE